MKQPAGCFLFAACVLTTIRSDFRRILSRLFPTVDSSIEDLYYALSTGQPWNVLCNFARRHSLGQVDIAPAETPPFNLARRQIGRRLTVSWACITNSRARHGFRRCRRPASRRMITGLPILNALTYFILNSLVRNKRNVCTRPRKKRSDEDRERQGERLSNDDERKAADY